MPTNRAVWSAEPYGYCILICRHGLGGRGCLLVRQTSSGEMAGAALDFVFILHPESEL